MITMGRREKFAVWKSGRSTVYFRRRMFWGQKFVISADLYTNTRPAGKSDDLTQSIHYGEVCQFMKTFMEEQDVSADRDRGGEAGGGTAAGL